MVCPRNSTSQGALVPVDEEAILPQLVQGGPDVETGKAGWLAHGGCYLLKDGLPVRLKRKCIFKFLRKCESHAKMGRFLRNFVCENFRFHKNFRENLMEIFAKMKNPLNLTVILHAWYM
jgi:hypothetical protein